MAAVIAKSASAAVVRPSSRSSVRPVAALKPAVKAASSAAPASKSSMMVWTPVNNK
jgi:ribulose-bisphosphate carboxylase small chain